MPGIYVTALITTLLAVLIYWFLRRRLRQPAHKSAWLVCFLIVLPLQPLTFYLVRLPLHHWLSSFFPANAGLFQWLQLLNREAHPVHEAGIVALCQYFGVTGDYV
ncbi:MAG TPA: hypothetical protein VGD99_14485 [Anaerolineae bacterium]|jgi:hypothetical protein